MTKVSLGFLPDPLLLPISAIHPSHKLEPSIASSRKFNQIRNSIGEIGLIEPLSVTSVGGNSGGYLILDGHLRLMAMKELGYEAVPCLIATDDESYTFNNRINRLSTIQEHRMICRAIERGVPAERLAKALSVDTDYINRKARLLEGICEEAAQLLKDHQFSVRITGVLRKMKPTRQVECVELMVSANQITVPYAEALFAATPDDSLVARKKISKKSLVTPEQMAKMESEMGSLQTQYKIAEAAYGQDILNLVIVRGYLRKLLKHEAVSSYLRDHYSDVLPQFESIVQDHS